MKNQDCKSVRRELDESLPHENFSAAVLDHLRGCAECSELHQKHMRLQRILGSLETVSAPADFDFRLRARLAKSQTTAPSWSYKRFAVGFAAMLILALSALFGSQFTKQDNRRVDQASVPRESSPEEGSTIAIKKEPKSDPNRTQGPLVNTSKASNSERPSTPRISKRSQAVVEYSSEGAKRIAQAPANPIEEGNAFPIDAPVQGLRLSLDDGRGNARTISFPTVSFGSQRVLTSNSQLTAKGVW